MKFKKLLTCLCSLVIICGIVNCRAYATTEYQAHIAVICEDIEKGSELISALCKSESELVYPLDSKFTGKANIRSDHTVIFDKDFDIKYHVEFHCMSSKSINRKTINRCSGAIILYDISNSALDPIVFSDKFYRSDLTHLVLDTKDAPLVESVVSLQNSSIGCLSTLVNCCYGILRCCGCCCCCCCGCLNWYNSLYFVTYGGDTLSPDEYKERHERLNAFTCELESYYGSDNKWGRGHPDLSDMDYVCRKALYWIAGQAERSIQSGFVEGDYNSSLFV